MHNAIKELDPPFPAKQTSGADFQNMHSAIGLVSKTPNALLPCQELRRHCHKVVKYTECLKNHAAAIGGNATDGCGEFMSSGEDGTAEGLKCSACNCHRNFHRKEIESDCPSCCFYRLVPNGTAQAKTFMEHHSSLQLPLQGPSYQTLSPNKCGSTPSEPDEKDVDDDREARVHISTVEKVKKRFRTKFTQEQKEKMLSFAQKAGWKIQRLDEKIIQEFCRENGIERRVLKVWMHNNKHAFAKETI